MSFYLQKKGIKHYKIWNFNPFKISIFKATIVEKIVKDMNSLIQEKKELIYLIRYWKKWIVL